MPIPSDPAMADLHHTLVGIMEQARKPFKREIRERLKITLVVRDPENPRMYVVETNDDHPAVEALAAALLAEDT